MGYTHYHKHQETSDSKWKKITKDFKKFLNRNPSQQALIQREYDDNGPPEITDEAIMFNGIEDAGHETLALYKCGSGGFAFCKTANKPYDFAVMVALLLYKHHSPKTLQLSSDGDATDWQPAYDLVKSLFGYELPDWDEI